MARASDTSDLWAPDSWLPGAWAPDSQGPRLSLERAIELFTAAKAAEGASPKTIVWYRMVLGRAARDLGAERALDALAGPELRDWLLQQSRGQPALDGLALQDLTAQAPSDRQ